METVEPYLRLASALMTLALTFWMFRRTHRDLKEAQAHQYHHDQVELTDEEYQDAHEREHAEEIRRRFDGRRFLRPKSYFMESVAD